MKEIFLLMQSLLFRGQGSLRNNIYFLKNKVNWILYIKIYIKDNLVGLQLRDSFHIPYYNIISSIRKIRKYQQFRVLTKNAYKAGFLK